MKNVNFMRKAILALGFMIGCGGMLISCAEEEIAPKTELLESVSVLDDGNGHNDNADGDRGKDNDDVIDIDINL